MATPKNNKPVKNKNTNLVWAVILVSAMGAGAFVFKDQISKPVPETAQEAAQPWYKEHARVAPHMIHLPDTPLILAEKEAEIDTTIKELEPRKPLRVKPVPPPEPHLEAITPDNKPTPPKPTAYEEALPEDVYTPTLLPPEPIIAPIQPPAIVEETPPTLQTDQPRWMKFALKISPPPADKPMIALVIDDMGLDRKRTKQSIELPGPMTMAFIPYSKHLKSQTTLAHNMGHELLLHLPMEPLNPKVDAGPNNLNTHLAPEDLIDRIHWNLERFTGYVGVNNHMGSRASVDVTVMTALMKELRNREMLFLDSRTNPKSIGAEIATLEGVPFAERNIFLDNVNEKEAVLKQLSILERVSKKHGFAVGIGHPRDGTIAALKEWLPLIADKGFTLVPISQIVMKNQNLS